MTRVEPGAVVVTLGTADGVSRSDRIELSLAHVVNDGPASAHRVVAIGVVTHVTEHTARVRLGVNEEASVGAVAVPSRAMPTASLLAPPRAHDAWTMGLILRPFAVLGRLGGGALLSGGIGRHFDSPLHVQGIFDPVGLTAVDQDRSISVANAAVIASYDVRLFEIGLGLGGQSVNSTQPFLAAGSGLTLAQLLRLGARDGLNLTMRTNIVLFHRELGFGGMIATLQVPLSTGYWLTLGGGGGDLGYGYGELGLRTLVEGNGGAGSKFLYVSLGGAGIFESQKKCSLCTEMDAGPMAGIGGEWRY